MKTPKTLQVWESFSHQLAIEFVQKYFTKDAEFWWVNREKGGVLFVNDYFFSLQDMVDFIRYKYPKQRVFEYYQYALRCYETQETKINIKHFK
jgi:hypothetical protein